MANPIHLVGNFKRDVTLDSFTTRDTDLSKTQLMMRYKHAQYRYLSTSRTIVCAIDEYGNSHSIMKWTITELLSDCDTFVVCCVLDPEGEDIKDPIKCRQRANTLMTDIVSMMPQYLKVNIVLELKVGNIEYMVKQTIKDYNASCLVMGANNSQTPNFKSLLLSHKTSLYNYLLDSSLVPVVAVTSRNVSSHKPHPSYNQESQFADNLIGMPSIYENPELGTRELQSVSNKHRNRFNLLSRKFIEVLSRKRI